MAIIPAARRLPARARLGIALGAAAGLVLLLASCQDAVTTPTPVRPMVAPGSMFDAAPSGRTLGPTLMPIAATNLGRATLGTMRTGLKVPALSAYVLHVSGRITVSTNSEVARCYPFPFGPKPPFGDEGSYGPSGTAIGALQVIAGAVTDGGNWLGLGLWLDRGGKDNASIAQSDTAFAWENQEVWVARGGILREIGGGSPVGCGPLGMYLLSSGQTVSVTILDGQELSLDPPIAIVRKGTQVTFTATSRGVLAEQPNMLFVPDSGVTNETRACDVKGLNPCVMTVRNNGELRASKFLQGRMRSASAAVMVYTKFDLKADKTSIKHGDTVTFTPLIDDAPGAAARWRWRADDKTELTDPCATFVNHRCVYAPASSGTMWAYTSTGGGGDSASAYVDVKTADDDDKPLTITMLAATYPLPDNSFTTREGENVIHLAARTSDPTRDGGIRWEVVDNPADSAVSVVVAQPANGAQTTFTVTAWENPNERGTARWLALRSCPVEQGSAYCRAHHDPVTLNRKAISYRVRAFVIDNGKRIDSSPLVFTQNAVDVLRQEYVDYAKPIVPSRDVLRSPRGSVHFTVQELVGTSDYFTSTPSLGWIGAELTAGLESMRTTYGAGITITGGYRNPQHNWVHVGMDQRHPAALRSLHVNGWAADLATGHDEDDFYQLARAGASAGACLEPPVEWYDPVTKTGGIIENWDHVHVSWDPAYGCADGWVNFAASLLPRPR